MGLLTEDEARLAGGSSSSNRSYYLYTGQTWWLASPNGLAGVNAAEYQVSSGGTLFSTNVDYSYGVRPVISLVSGIRTNEGDGTRDNPYTIEVREAS